tara:strand:+ start:130 stop:846 length:717 start_codon:yes stop_codon:yes gene_type:complete
MATTTATITLASADLLSNALSFSDTSSLTTAGTSTGLTLTSGLARTNFTVGGSSPFTSKVIYRANDATSNGANKVYLKNMSTTASEYFTVFIDQEQMGRLYAGDWAFFPWSAVDGTEETFIVTIANTWAAGDTWDFDGITTTAANSTVADIAAQIHAQNFPNWTTSISTAAVTFVARYSGAAGVVTGTTAITGDTVTTAGDGTAAITSGAVGTRSEADIIVEPSVATTMDLEHMLFKQ